MPEFQGTTVSTKASEARARATRQPLIERAQQAVQEATDRYTSEKEARTSSAAAD
jgi:hypothetical protein